MEELYREVLMEHYKNPENKKTMIKPDIHKEDSNPLCGDQIKIFLRLKDEKIIDASFQGKGCVICLSTADMLMDELKNKTLKQIQDITREDLLDLVGNPTHANKSKMRDAITNNNKKGIIEHEANKNP